MAYKWWKWHGPGNWPNSRKYQSRRHFPRCPHWRDSRTNLLIFWPPKSSFSLWRWDEILSSLPQYIYDTWFVWFFDGLSHCILQVRGPIRHNRRQKLVYAHTLQFSPPRKPLWTNGLWDQPSLSCLVSCTWWMRRSLGVLLIWKSSHDLRQMLGAWPLELVRKGSP